MGNRRAHLAATAACVVAAVGLAPAPAQAAAHRQCTTVDAEGVGQDLGDGHTVATLTADGAPLGTSEGTFTVTGVDGSVVSFAGPITLRRAKGPGTLTVQVVGTLDAATGAFRSTSTSFGGTGPLRKVTGSLTFAGQEDLTSGAFTETVTGELCR